MKASTGRRRVLIIVENLPVPFDRRVWSEATTLVAAGYEVSVISPALKDYEAPYEEIDGVHVYRHPVRQAGDEALGYVREYAGALLWQLRLAWRVRRERGFEIIHACNPPDLIFLVALIFKAFFGTRFVFDHHDLCPELYEAKFGGRGLLWRLLFLFERATFLLADISIATNESYRRIALRRGRMRRDDVFIVRSGPDIDRLKIAPPKFELKKGAEILVGYVGVIGRQEGLDLLIEAARHLAHIGGLTRAHFAVVGDGPDLEAVKSLAVKKGVADLFTFTGRADDALLLDVLNTADICVNPDRASAMNDKSTMNKILEYMALGKPIVQFDLHEGRQSAGGASLYAARDDALDFARKLQFLIDNPSERRRMGEIGRERVLTGLSWRHCAPALLAAYDRAFAKIDERRADARPRRAVGAAAPQLPR